MHSSNHIIKFADDTTVVALISKNDESAYREEVQQLTDWCRTNNLSLNVDKTKEMVVDFRRTRRDHSPLHIDGSTVEIVKSTKFLGVHLAEDLTWSLNISTITKKAQQRLYFLRRLRKAHAGDGYRNEHRYTDSLSQLGLGHDYRTATLSGGSQTQVW
ncbi:hypothetical protein NFI96_020724 [Prochilodus magdalenae]|nr:hypothetical protein NFI96_020724 [Prochilodus magdalenae]